LPEDPVVFEPGRALDEWSHVEPVRARIHRRTQVELEPRDLSRTDVRRRLHGDAIESRPVRRRRAVLPVTAENARAILARLAAPRPEVGDLAHATADPAERTGVVVRERRDRGPARAEAHVPALAVPRRVESGDARRDVR